MSDRQVTMELSHNGERQSAGSKQEQQGAVVSFHNIHYKVKQGGGCLCRKKVTTKDILIDLNGIMKPGLNAIMGASGSGKSSFLDVLAARKDPAGLSGEVLIDGAPQPPNFKCLSGYVVQDDVLMGTLTVRENFTFSAALRLPAAVSQQEKEQKVNKLIQELGLGQVADSRVGTQLFRGISGGERKRTSIGMELIIDPPVLFLDEPTTGLDASTANSVLLLLKRMANYGRTIILSIHQPRYSIYRLFDSLTLLVNGKQVYHGPAQRALEYFSDIGYTCEHHNNPADFFLDVINGQSAIPLSKMGSEDLEFTSIPRQAIEEKLIEEYRNCHDFKETKTELERIVQGKQITTTPPSRTITYNTNFLTQFRWVLKRTFRNLLLNPQTSIAEILLDILMMRTIPAIIYSCVSYFMIGLKPTVEAFFLFMLAVALVAYTATSMTIAISADQTVVAIANIFTTICFVFMMIFAGLLVNLPSIVSWLAWLKYFSIPGYGLTALQINEFRGLEFCKKVNTASLQEDSRKKH
ncbi:ATP-binding cassette sub-family G member 2 [Larimichthys crocea]|uniref:ATP-binding cassette sub-family G member 2 n=1 Tax=Larimichthys crocea TaxID=215358 RepID=A0A6G0HKE7_LARCR|nr:ATP-binding cassette sub-family G member 2 [Larimichthys crocea]